MNVLQLIDKWDTNLFLFINGYHNDFFDGLMFAFSARLTWVPFYLALFFLVVKRWRRESFWLFFFIVIGVFISDQIASGILKNTVQRLRPSHVEELSGIIHLVKGYAGGKFGFASSHASNTFCIALLTSILFKQRIYTGFVFVWAIMTSYSRVYLGVHYPTDVVVGIFIGFISAFFVYYMIVKTRPSLLRIDDQDSLVHSIKFPPSAMLLLTFLLTIIYSLFLF